MSAKSEVGRIYDALRSTGFTHFQIRAMLLYCMGYSRKQISNVMRNRAQRIHDENIDAVNRLRFAMTGNAKQNGHRLLEVAWATRPHGTPLYEYAIVKRAIQSDINPENRRVLLALVAPLRNLERREGIRLFTDREVRGYLSVLGVVSSPIKQAFERGISSEASYVGRPCHSQSRNETQPKNMESEKT